MIYSTEPAPRVVVPTAFNCANNRLYTVHVNGSGLEYVAFRTPIPGIMGSSEVQLWSPTGGLTWYFTDTLNPNVVIYDDIPDQFKLVFKQGTPA